MGKIAKCGPRREFSELGLECVVVNPGIVVDIEKENVFLNKSEIARRLSKSLQDNESLEKDVVNPFWKHAFEIVHMRTRHLMELKKVQSDLVYFANIHELRFPNDLDILKWSPNFVELLKMIKLDNQELKENIGSLLEKIYVQQKLLATSNKFIKQLADDSEIRLLRKRLEVIPYVGVIRAISIIIEIQDITCFKSFDDLCSYSGIGLEYRVQYQRGKENEVLKGANPFLYRIIIQISRDIVKKDSKMKLKYNRYCTKVSKKEALDKIGIFLLKRIWDAWCTRA